MVSKKHWTEEQSKITVYKSNVTDAPAAGLQ